jgi:hypothetical protein
MRQRTHPFVLHRFFQTRLVASVWIDAVLLLVHRFFQTPAVASVWIDAPGWAIRPS